MINRTICCLAVSFTAGLLYGSKQCVWLCVAAFALLVFRTVWICGQQGRQAVFPAVLQMLLCVILFTGGTYRYQKQQENFEAVRQYAQRQKNIQASGEIYWKEQKQQQFIYYLKDAGILMAERYEPCGRIQVYTSKDSYDIGDYIQIVGTYEAFQLPRNEGNFNEEQYYYSKKIGLRIQAHQEQILEKNPKKYQMWLQKLRSEMEQVLKDNMSQRTAGIMANMTLGSKNLADSEVKALYQKTGISHILAVSGLHVSILGMGLYRLLRRIYCPVWAASIAASGVVYSFGLLTGMELSTTRAVVMFVLMMAAGSIRVTYDTMTALGVSALLQLWNNPFALWYAGFLFSYSAVLGAVVINGMVKQVVGSKRKHKILDTVRTSLCIQMATIPASLFFYYEISPYSIFANGCVLPFMGILLFLGALGGGVGIAHSRLAAVILTVPQWILEGCEWICQFFTGLPGSSVITGKPSMGKIILYYILLLFLLLGMKGLESKKYLDGVKELRSKKYLDRMKRLGSKKYLVLWMGAAALLCCGNGSKGAEIDFLDVGQGDGIFMQSEKGEGVFIDGGSTDVKKAGTYRILPFLKCRGKQGISLWFVSHLDADHVNGLTEVLESDYPVENLIFAEGVVKDDALQALVQLAKEKGTSVSYLKAGICVTLDDMWFTVLYPWEEGTDRNQFSMVLFVEAGGMTGIFSGDIGQEQELELVKNEKIRHYLEKPVTFYKAAHHGSNGSNSLELLEMIAPDITVVSCGENNSYGHPGKEAVERMEQAGSSIYYTMKNGQLTLRKGEGEVKVWKFQN